MVTVRTTDKETSPVKIVTRLIFFEWFSFICKIGIGCPLACIQDVAICLIRQQYWQSSIINGAMNIEQSNTRSYSFQVHKEVQAAVCWLRGDKINHPYQVASLFTTFCSFDDNTPLFSFEMFQKLLSSFFSS